jgi:hypothetical protein
MGTLFNPADRQSALARVQALRADSPRAWGKMTPAQMLAHCSASLSDACGDRVCRQALIGKIFAPLVLRRVLSDKPMGRNAPTDPTYRMTDDKDFSRERERLVALVDRFVDSGVTSAEGRVHPFFGKLTGDQWGRLMHKHLDHHLQQFGV